MKLFIEKNKKIILFVSLILIAIGVVGFYYINENKDREDYFNNVVLSDNNLIVNNVLPKYIDTILSVGLDRAGLVGVNVIVNEMNDGVESIIPDYELKAHIREWNGNFYLFVGSVNKSESIKVLSHEIIHIHQYYSEELKYFEGKIYWKGDEYDLNNVDYDKRPWEEDAFDRETSLSNAIESVLQN